MPPGLQLVESAEKGRCCVAQHRMARGTSVLVAEPLACVLRGTARTTHCHWCFSALDPSGTMPRCSRCKYAYYCGRSCQQAHWRAEHSQECALVARLPRYPTESVVLAARVLRAAEKDPDARSQLAALRTHTLSAAALPPEEHVAMAMFLREFVGAETLERQCEGRAVRAVELFSVLQTNAFSIADQEMRAIGVGLYPAAAMLNHSCEPNASTVFVGRAVHVRTVCDVEAGAELCVSYVDLAQSSEARRETLQRCFGFVCRCPRCLDESALDGGTERARLTAPCPAAQPLLQRAAEAEKEGKNAEACGILEQVVALLNKQGAPEHSVSLIAAQTALFTCFVSAQRWQEACSVGRLLLGHLPCLFLQKHSLFGPSPMTTSLLPEQTCTQSTGRCWACSTFCRASWSGCCKTPRRRFVR